MTAKRSVALFAHSGRENIAGTACFVIDELLNNNITPVIPEEEAFLYSAEVLERTKMLGRELAIKELEVVLVVGGDGTLLRAAEFVCGEKIPLLGVNLGHVGFLAESEEADLAETVRHVVDRDYQVEERLCLDANIFVNNVLTEQMWALNEVSVEKSERSKMLEVVTEVDSRPISSYGCDGVILATPTGSTAYAFSSGGPVVWPEVEALLLVPISAHALFSRPLVTSPDSTLAVEVISSEPHNKQGEYRFETHGVVWCDGRRSFQLPAGARLEVTRSQRSVRLAHTVATPFSERLVKKFKLPVHGWRGRTRKAQRPAAPPARHN